MKISAKVFAKVNLNLAITGVRNNMHTLDSLMHSIGISDRITMTVGEDGVYMNGKLSPDNIVCKVVEETKKAGLPPIRFDIEKGIPMEAGLGGSSADASCALRLIEKEFGLVLNPLKFGSDVHFMTEGGLARVCGIGEELTEYEPLDLDIVIAKGKGGVSTKEAYGLFDQNCETVKRDTLPLINLLREKDFETAKHFLFNDLQFVSKKINPEVKRVYDLIKAHTPLALMCGSGSAVFGIFKNKEDAIRAKEKISPYVEFCCATKTEKEGVVFEKKY